MDDGQGGSDMDDSPGHDMDGVDMNGDGNENGDGNMVDMDDQNDG
jgi:hypothetical protein